MNSNLVRVTNRVEQAARIIGHTTTVDLGAAGLALSWTGFNDIADGIEALAVTIVEARVEVNVKTWRNAAQRLRNSDETDVRAHAFEQAAWDNARDALCTLHRLGRKTEGRLADLTDERISTPKGA